MYQWCNGLKLILHLYKSTRERTLSASGDFPGTNVFTLFYGLDRFSVYLVRFKLFFFLALLPLSPSATSSCFSEFSSQDRIGLPFCKACSPALSLPPPQIISRGAEVHPRDGLTWEEVLDFCQAASYSFCFHGAGCISTR